jgi:hypothetical protein
LRRSDVTTAEQLSNLMEFDRVIYVDESGEASNQTYAIDAPEAPEAYWRDGEDVILSGGSSDWTLLRGASGQHAYQGACMHESEYIGGGLARNILETHGYWVSLVVYDEAPEDEDADQIVGWALAYHEPTGEVA